MNEGVRPDRESRNALEPICAERDDEVVPGIHPGGLGSGQVEPDPLGDLLVGLHR